MKKILLWCLLMVSIILNAQITLGEGSTAVGNVPINTNYGYSYSQQIFTKQEINASAAGNITGLKFFANPSAGLDNSSSWVVYLGHTSKTNFSGGSDWIPIANLTEVFSGTVTNANGVVEIVFSTPFAYDNSQNLVIAVDENTSGYDFDNNTFTVYTLPNAQNRAILYRSDGNDPDPSSPPTGTLQEYRAATGITGLTPSSIPTCASVTYPVNNATLIPVSPAITWAMSPGATSYKVSIGTTPGGTDIVNQQTVTTASFTPSSPLSVNTTYYLRVVSVGSGGESVDCSTIKFKTIPPPPTNDECSSAVTLTVNPDLNCAVTTAGTTLSATDSGVDPDPCYGNPDDDVWYKFTATASSHIISLKNITSVGSNSSTDTYFQVLSGSCGTMNSILCSDPDTGTVNGLNPGDTYYIRVFSYAAGAVYAQSFNICIGTLPPPPSNDDCAAAITLAVNPDMNCGSITAGTTLSATDSGVDPDPCYGNPDDDVWYKFTATHSSHIVSLKNVEPAGIGTSSDIYFQVLSGDCNSLSNVFCSDPDYGIIDGLTVGNTYYVRVYSYGGAGSAQSFNICIGTLPPPPLNDECTTAITLTVNPDMNCGNKTSGHTLGATDSNLPVDPCDGEADDDVWFKFTATSNTHVISLGNTMSIGSVSSYSLLFQVFSGDCSNLASVDCSDYEDIKVISGLTIGQTYYIRVYTGDGAGNAQSFDICVGTIPPPPANDACSGALVASVFPYTYTQTDAAGATNNDGFITACSSGMNDGTWFTFTGDGTEHEIKVTMPSGSDFDAELGVYSGTCGNLTCVNSIDAGLSGGEETMTIPTVAGTVYLVNVGHYDNDEDKMEGTFTITINKQTLGTSETAKDKNEIKIYPNPFADVLNISKVDQVKSIVVLDISGRVVKTIETPSSVLHLGDLKQGMYLIMLNMKDGTKQTMKAIKK
ncbi:T9SS type A sorting domain-containing protein [Chryseobacterium sp. c4a]|uniref:T9SS type A sorting domain-containing protein n=1 Tax=Chryseobacterium sp. c4a TaxID=1573582 RepID=UPI001357E82B|nr:T9SS type A sorting domain-containing protein [Chryseobacterium sp. c4a]